LRASPARSIDVCSTRRCPGGGYRDAGPTRFRLTGTERNPIVICDDPEAFR
jgi:hypothetical protein